LVQLIGQELINRFAIACFKIILWKKIMSSHLI
jgi:hypothetical protein